LGTNVAAESIRTWAQSFAGVNTDFRATVPDDVDYITPAPRLPEREDVAAELLPPEAVLGRLASATRAQSEQEAAYSTDVVTYGEEPQPGYVTRRSSRMTEEDARALAVFGEEWSRMPRWG